MFKRTLLALGTVFFLSACGVSNIGYDQNRLSLQVEQNQVLLDATLLHKSRDNFSSLYITKKVLRLKDGNVIVYEDARTDMSYEFEPRTTTIMKVVFEARSIVMIYARNQLYVYQLTLHNGKVLNVIAQQDETQRLRFVYGMSSRQLNTMLKQLDSNAPVLPYKDVMLLKSVDSAIVSKWNTRKVHFYPLVVPLPLRFGW